jgi:ankyrin repeat protein
LEAGFGKMTTLLLAADADPSIRDGEGRTALHWAAIQGDDGFVAALIEHPKLANQVDAADGRGETALHYACFFGWVGQVERLLEAGTSVNSVDLDGVSPLHWATINGGWFPRSTIVPCKYILLFYFLVVGGLWATINGGSFPIEL